MIEAPAFYDAVNFRSNQDKFFVNDLALRALHLRSNWQREGIPQDWADLPGIGFMMRPQMDLLKGSDIKTWMDRTEQDLRGFVVEYLTQKLTFPIFNDIRTVDGEARIWSNRYQKLWADTISDKERDGSVKRTLVKKVEPFLLSERGRMAVITSPDGWSGLIDHRGRAIVYPDSQTYVLLNNGSEIVGFTIKTDFSLPEHRAFIKNLGGKELLDDATLPDYVESAVTVDSEKEETIEGIVSKMMQTRFETSGSIFAFENRGWDEIFEDLRSREELWSLDARTQKIIDRFRNYVLFNRLTEEEIKEALAITILEMSQEIRGESIIAQRSHVVIDKFIGISEVFDDLVAVGGCAGGGSSNSPFNKGNIIDSLTPRLTNSTEHYEFKEGKCVGCGVDPTMVGPCGLCKPCDNKERSKNGSVLLN